MLEVGSLVRIKEIPGTRLASKRKPLWAIVTGVANWYVNEADRRIRVELHKPIIWKKFVTRREEFTLPLRCMDPAPKKVPDDVCVWLATRALLS